jgi:glutamate synthase domain-containing protein 3
MVGPYNWGKGIMKIWAFKGFITKRVEREVRAPYLPRCRYNYKQRERPALHRRRLRPDTITINGVPGNDLAAFMDGDSNGNAQDGVANTMNEGKIVISGHAGDVLGYGMRGGKLYIKGDVGYRVGIHMKGFKDKLPVIIAGGTAGDFFGEYMAGGYLILLGIGRDKDTPIAGDYVGTGMHGGVMYIRGEVDPLKCGAEVGIVELTEEDNAILEKYLKGVLRGYRLQLRRDNEGRIRKALPEVFQAVQRNFIVNLNVGRGHPWQCRC